MMYGIYDGSAIIARFVTPMTVRSNHPVYSSDTLNLGRQVTRRAAQRWEIETRLEPLSHTAEELFVHVVNNAYSTPVKVIAPQNWGAVQKRGATATTPWANAAAGDSTVTITNNTNGFIPKGTFVKFSGVGTPFDKVYMTTTSLSNNGVIGVYPEVRTALVDAVMQWRDDVQMTCYYDLDTVTGMVYEDGILMDLGRVKLVEKVR